MEERNSSVSEIADQQNRAIEQGAQSIERGQQSLAKAMQYPFKQAVGLQREMAEIFMSGLELTESTQRMGLDLTRSLSQGYLDAIGEIAGEAGQELQGGQGGQGRQQPIQSRTGTQGSQGSTGPIQPQSTTPTRGPMSQGYQQQFQPQPNAQGGGQQPVQQYQEPQVQPYQEPQTPPYQEPQTQQ